MKRGPGVADVLGFAHEVLNSRVGEGWNLKSMYQHGYQMISTDGIAIGEREDDVMIQLSGEVSRHEWEPFARAADSISRLDLQVTFELPEADTGLAKKMLRQARDNMRDRPGSPPTNGTFETWSKAEMREKFKGDIPAGQTMYLGAASSDFRLIGYDKGAESGAADPGLLWRNELRLRRQLAKRNARDLLDAMTDRKGGDMIRARDRVWSEVRRRGIPPRFPARGLVPMEMERQTTDENRWREWAKMIGPAMQRKAETYYGAEWPVILSHLLMGKEPPNDDDSGFTPESLRRQRREEQERRTLRAVGAA